MDGRFKVKDEITLSELFKILWQKVLILVLAFAIGVIGGGIFGVLQTWNVHYYGTTVEFYINPNKSENSSSETGSQYGVYGAYGTQVMESMVELLESESFSEILMLDVNGMPERGISPEIDAKIDAGKKDEALEEWRKTANYRRIISLVNSSVSYSYIKNTNAEDTLAKSFIVVSISVLNDEDSAKFLFDRVKTRVPTYVAQNMIKPDGYDTTNCQRITRLDDVKLLNPDNVLSTVIKYAILLGAASFLIACVVIVVIDYSDKRLRNFERTMEQFNMPILGVIPTITEKETISDANEEAKA